MNEISSYNYNDIITLTEILLRNNYACMISVEDTRTDGTCLYVLNYICCEDEANRNQIVFMNRDEFESEYCEVNYEDTEHQL